MRYTVSEINELMNKNNEIVDVKLTGWIDSKRENELILNIVIRDGSCFNYLNCICEEKNFKNKDEFNLLKNIEIGSSVLLKGIIKNEFSIISGKIFGKMDKKIHRNIDFLRDNQHLRMRNKTFQGIGIIRNTLQFEIHNFFNKLGFLNLTSPILTTTDCENLGETFNVLKNGNNFFDKRTNLTVSAQLHLEALVHSFHKVYNFGPTFRAESGNSEKHLSEFWMVEPEIGFILFSELMENMEIFLKYICAKLLKRHRDILEYFDVNYENGLLNKLEWVGNVENKFLRKSYDDCLKFLWNEIECGNIIIGRENRRVGNGVLILEKRPEYGEYFGDEYGLILERYLIEEFGNKPFFMTNFPKKFKPFYMKSDNSNPDIVQACDLLVPGIGELMGGSMREDNYEKLKTKIDENGIKDLDWYLELRKNGSIPHGGYGVGFERLMCYVTGMRSVKDVIPFYRVEGSCFA